MTITGFLCVIGGIVAIAAACGAAADIPPVIYGYNMSAGASERVLMASLQGVVARRSPEIHLGRSVWLDELQRVFPETKVVWSNDPAFFLRRYRNDIAGYVRCDAETRNVGTSVAGVLDAVVVDATTEPMVIAAGLPMLEDVRGRSSIWAYTTYGHLFNREALFHQAPSIAHHLRDYAIYKRGFMFHEDPAWMTFYAGQQNHSLVFGWAPSEYDFFHRASVTNTLGVAADWLENASVLSQWSVEIETQRTHTPLCAKAVPDVHYVAFIMSDGDNIQWLNGTFFQLRWWGSPHRGAFTMNWDTNPTFADINPLGFNYYYRTASTGTHVDSFVTASGPGVMYPSQYMDTVGFAGVNGAAMARTDQRVLSLLEDSYNPRKLADIIADDRVMGMMLKIGDAYRGGGGSILWFNGKPCVTVKYSLWDGFDSPVSLVTALNAAPRSPLTDQRSYSIVNVHPWSTGFEGDPMSNVRYVADRLDSHVRMVTLEELVTHLRNNFGAPVCPPCAVDFNNDGTVTSQDFFDYMSCFFEQAACEVGLADFNDDGVVNSQDFFDFLALFVAGCG